MKAESVGKGPRFWYQKCTGLRKQWRERESKKRRNAISETIGYCLTILLFIILNLQIFQYYSTGKIKCANFKIQENPIARRNTYTVYILVIREIWLVQEQFTLYGLKRHRVRILLGRLIPIFFILIAVCSVERAQRHAAAFK